MVLTTDNRTLHIPFNANGLPDHWLWERLDDVCLGIFDCLHSTPVITANGPFVVRSQDIRSGVFRVDQAARVSEETYRHRIRTAEPRHGDLLYSREGTYFGIAAEIPLGLQVCLGQRMVLIRPDPIEVDFRFLRYWLNSPVMARHIQGYRDGTVAERLNLPTIRALPVVVPPLDEQRAIARMLAAFDDKIELNRQMNHSLEAAAMTIFKSWFVHFDPVAARVGGRAPFGMNSKTAALFPNRFVESELELIPEGWRVSSIGEEYELTMGQSPPGDTYNDVEEGLPFYQGRTDFTVRFPSRRIYCTAPTRFAEEGDTLVSVRAPVGDVNMACERCAIGRGVAATRHNSGSRSFTYYVMRSLSQEFEVFNGDGTVFGSIGRTDFERISVISPASALVDAFELRVYPLDERIKINDQEMRDLAALRDAILPKLLSGEIRVHEAEKVVAEDV